MIVIDDNNFEDLTYHNQFNKSVSKYITGRNESCLKSLVLNLKKKKTLKILIITLAI